MRIAVVGAGRIGALHARTLVGLPAVEQLLIADADRSRAVALAGELDCIALDDVPDVWSECPDGVVIAAPTAQHVALVHAALDAGAGVLCEKPLAPSLRESAWLAERAEQAGVPVRVGFQRRFDPAFDRVREAVARASCGRSHVLRVRHADVGPPPPGYLATAGSMFVDMCIHDYDTVRWIAGEEVEAVGAVGARLLGIPELERHGDVDTAVTTLQLAGGAVAVVEASRRGPDGYEATAAVVGERGVAGMPAAPAATWSERFAEAFAREDAAFVATLAGRPDGGATARDATQALRIALAAERAFNERRVVRVAEIEQ